jgi:hypothetical protein
MAEPVAAAPMQKDWCFRIVGGWLNTALAPGSSLRALTFQ